MCPTGITANAPPEVWRAAAGQSAEPRPMESRYLIFVGNVKPHKNLSGLLTAFEQISKAHDIKLVIVGKKEGFLRADEKTVSKAARLGERIRFTGPIPDADLINWVRHAEALVFPSFYEGFGIPPLEAMTVSCPTIVSDIPPLRETCADAAMYVRPDDPLDIAAGIERLLTQPNLADDLRERGRQRAAQFHFADAVKAFETGLSTIMQK